MNNVNWLAVIVFVVLPGLIGYYLFFYNPQIYFPLHIESDQNTGGRMLIEMSGEPKESSPGIISLIQEVFSSPPGFDWYIGCFEDTTTFSPPANENQTLIMYLDTPDNKSYSIGKLGNATCIPIQAGKKFSAFVNFHGQNITLDYGQSINIHSIPQVSNRLELWSAFARTALFVLTWDTVLLLIQEIFKKVYRTKKTP